MIRQLEQNALKSNYFIHFGVSTASRRIRPAFFQKKTFFPQMNTYFFLLVPKSLSAYFTELACIIKL